MFLEENVVYRYKYLPFNENSIKTIVEGSISFTCPLAFNDPFDCRPYVCPNSALDISAKRPDLYRKVGQELGLSPAKRIMSKSVILKRLKDRVESGKWITDLLVGVGVVSLSTDALNTLMWSHYADFHRGFVLEFRIPLRGREEEAKFARDRLTPFPVRYSENRPHVEMFSNPHDLVEKILLTKSLDWAYEAEERVVDQIRGPGIFKYRRDDILRSIICGVKMPLDDFNRLQAVVAALAESFMPNLRIFRAEEYPRKYGIHVPGHPRLGNLAP
ncbi:DUF2971 domain-containing protein [Methyloversatilis sp.]|uniref:DUF2971 domain-containing protein n=1 Tax=Methyloversatilis sp. TaxID=2569862 RepID=UPI002733F872|nr:DUF2971 domain-containing protein [Methyloversatilis sp.]MDP3453853.1 DUF2971 domain-containing protein [Methyloversatilis sp.]MDP3578690.1 DUF2971 domain-containing protein [Methyloversatilis sp.]